MENNRLNKFLGIVFAFALMAGCASTDTQDSSEATAGAGADGSSYGDSYMDEGYGDATLDGQDAIDADLQYVFYFAFDRAELDASVRGELDKHIANLRGNERNVRLEGHADERGTREYNMALGERRANAVANYLIVNGIQRHRIETVSYGEERPVAFSHDSAAWEKNRRVELKLN